MTFAEMLRVLENFGPITGGDPSDWAQDMINGVEFKRKGIKDNHVMQDGDVVPEKRLRRTAKEMFVGKKSRKLSK